MDKKSMKLEIVQKILGVEEEELLQQINVLLDESNQDWWNTIGKDEQNAILDGIKQLDENKGIPHDQVMQELKKKLI